MPLTSKNKNPDILTCLANLSSDEVFTPPQIANDMLDLLPQELFSSSQTTFFDPACKSGVFLREIVKRLNSGTADKIPDLHYRIEHIMMEQVSGIAITDLTAKMSRRTLYCSMNVGSKFSVCRFADGEGRIRFRKTAHTFGRDGRCVYCGARSNDDGKETHAYEFIHTEKPEDILGHRIDVVISNPPYQMSDGGGNGASAIPIYQEFVEQAIKLNPKYIVMIIPARWYAGGKGLDDFRRDMLKDSHIRVIHDYPDATELFSGVQIKGGVCYFLWDRDYNGDCEVITHLNGNVSTMTRPLTEKGVSTFIRYNEAIPILRKVSTFGEKSFSELVSPRKPFGFPNTFKGYKDKRDESDLLIYVSGNDREIRGTTAYCPVNEVCRGRDMIPRYKVYIAKAGSGSDSFPHSILGRPFVGEPGTICTETYLLIGPFDDKPTCENVISYITTKFFRFLVLLMKNTQNATREVYSLVPMQDFSRSWTDEDLYNKYGLTPEETAFIDSMIRPMTLKEDARS